VGGGAGVGGGLVGLAPGVGVGDAGASLVSVVGCE